MRLADKLLRAYFKKRRKNNETASRLVMRRGGTLPQPDCIDYETARTRRILGFG